MAASFPMCCAASLPPHERRECELGSAGRGHKTQHGPSSTRSNDYFLFYRSIRMQQRKRLRELIHGKETVMLPGAYDAIVAKTIEQVGFDGVCCVGSGTVNGLLGLPDIGLATLSEMVQNAKWIADAVNIPVISDADTGFG